MSTQINPEYFYNLAKKDYERRVAEFLRTKMKVNKAVKVYLLFPVLKKYGINSWAELERAMVEIDEKVSTLPAMAREVVIHLYTHCLYETANAFKKNLIDA